MSNCLYTIGMKNDIFLARDFSDFRNRLNRSGFVVGMHNRNENGFVRQSGQNLSRRNKTVFVNGKIGGLEAFFLKPLGSFQNGMVFDGRNNNMVALRME